MGISFNATEVIVEAQANLREDAKGKIDIGSINMELDFGRIAISPICLFPKKNGNCCPGKWKDSCNPIFARTIHKIINNDGNALVAKFKPQISEKIGDIVRVFLNGGLQNLD